VFREHEVEEEEFEFLNEFWRVLICGLNLILTSIFNLACVHVQDRVPELFDHVELLEETVEVTNAAWIL
jgi:hypothetical protein